MVAPRRAVALTWISMAPAANDFSQKGPAENLIQVHVVPERSFVVIAVRAARDQ